MTGHPLCFGHKMHRRKKSVIFESHLKKRRVGFVFYIILMSLKSCFMT